MPSAYSKITENSACLQTFLCTYTDVHIQVHGHADYTIDTRMHTHLHHTHTPTRPPTLARICTHAHSHTCARTPTCTRTRTEVYTHRSHLRVRFGIFALRSRQSVTGIFAPCPLYRDQVQGEATEGPAPSQPWECRLTAHARAPRLSQPVPSPASALTSSC